MRTKKLWERLRIKSAVPKEERQALVTELFDIITGNVKDFVFKHDSVRVIQTALKYGSKEQKKEIAIELKGEYKTLAESRYAKFLVAKILVDADAELREAIISEFYGHVRRLINNPEASWILDDTYRSIATREQKATMLREWYGAEFALFKGSKADDASPKSADLASILAASPEKRKPIMESLHGLINQLVQKKLTGFTMLHDAMLQYQLNMGDVGTSEATEFLELLKGDEEGDLLKNLAFTASGARVVARALSTSTAKDRKLLLRVYKDHIDTLAHDPNGVLVLVAAYEVIDDTVMTAKLVFPDLVAAKLASDPAQQTASIATRAVHPVARAALLYPFTGGQANNRLLPTTTDGVALLAELRQLRAATSKKDPAARLQELARALAGYDGALLKTVAAEAETLARDSFGTQFVTEVLLGAEGDKTDANKAIAALAAGDSADETHIARNPAAGRMLKTLALGARFNPETKSLERCRPPLGFAEVLWPVVRARAVDWATGENSFVVLNMLDNEDMDAAQRKEVGDAMKKGRKALEKAAKEGNKGAKMILEKL